MEVEPTPLKLILLLLSFSLLAFPTSSKPNQATTLRKFIDSRKSNNPPSPEPWEVIHQEKVDQVYIGPQDGLKDADEIEALPGQPQGVDFDQYAGYVTVDPKNGRALFYYLVESPQDSKSKPLVLWLNGGPGCSSLGYGAMEELGPFRVNSDGKSLYRNIYSWNNVANVIFLESPAGVGFSYSNTSSDYVTGDKKTAEDSYTFLVNWLERFPHYKNRDFFITGESYAGHYVPQLAYKIISYKNTKINLKGIAIGNAWIDYSTGERGRYDYYWTHAMNSDETIAGIKKFCDFHEVGDISSICLKYLYQAYNEVGDIDSYNIYAPTCNSSEQRSSSTCTVKDFDPCSDIYVETYLNLGSVQTALHARATNWESCDGHLTQWTDSPPTILPTITQLIAIGIRVWIYSGDVDAAVPVTASRYAINTMGLQIETAWRPWYSSHEVGGYVTGYKGLTFATIRGAGHEVPSYQPQRALTMISSFINGTLPPSS